MFEEDQMMRAIAMSLGQDVPAGVPASEQQVKQVGKRVNSAGNNFSLFTGHVSFQIFLLVGYFTN